MMGYVVVWCETGADGKRVKRREEYSKATHGWPLEGLHNEAKYRAGQLRRIGLAACIEPLR